MKILAIRFARLGDVVLLLPALSLLKDAFPDARLTFLTGRPCAPIASMCPAIDEVIAVDRVAMRDGPLVSAMVKMVRLVRDVRKRHFDLVIDFHSFRETNLLTWFSGAPSRMGMKRHMAPYLGFCFNRPPILEDKSAHVADMFQKVAAAVAPVHDGRQSRLGASPAAIARHCVLVPPADLQNWANEAVPALSRVALYIDAPVPERIWPPERFAQVADSAVEKFGAAVVVLAGAGGNKLTERLQKASRYPDRISVFANVTLPQLAALIASCGLFISNDTGPMHIGPAVGVPTLALFSVGYPEHFRPLGLGDRFLRGNPIETIEVQDVIDAIEPMWPTAGRGPRY